MNNTRIIADAFPPGANGYGVSDEFIVKNPNLMEIDGELDYMRYVPAYMDWCIRNKDNYDQLVTDYTVNALAVYGRTKLELENEYNRYLNFKYLCNDKQRAAVVAFYSWCLENLTIIDDEQIKRSMKHWR